ncbi:unnamed protein product [Acanthosepion pharaonis]|uniref:Uncharacterized protein n=1 Tax=Acanthosepion pharaonis TaxID=158019 RepID=A0A812B218_ACAPH|nr:unnamed protein product [Sepia pharaonis]
MRSSFTSTNTSIDIAYNEDFTNSSFIFSFSFSTQQLISFFLPLSLFYFTLFKETFLLFILHFLNFFLSFFLHFISSCFSCFLFSFFLFPFPSYLFSLYHCNSFLYLSIFSLPLCSSSHYFFLSLLKSFILCFYLSLFLLSFSYSLPTSIPCFSLLIPLFIFPFLSLSSSCPHFFLLF